ncbi:hypothetical protein ACGFIH_26750 [Micromonospora parva]|uniref:hypothetical protein n=1 Tax=Micromonospora parva TaxID=1464048 RepID=UPI00371755B1
MLDLPGHGQDRADGQDVWSAAARGRHTSTSTVPPTGSHVRALRSLSAFVDVGLGLVFRVRGAAIFVSEHWAVPPFDEGQPHRCAGEPSLGLVAHAEQAEQLFAADAVGAVVGDPLAQIGLVRMAPERDSRLQLDRGRHVEHSVVVSERVEALPDWSVHGSPWRRSWRAAGGVDELRVAY